MGSASLILLGAWFIACLWAIVASERYWRDRQFAVSVVRWLAISMVPIVSFALLARGR